MAGCQLATKGGKRQADTGRFWIFYLKNFFSRRKNFQRLKYFEWKNTVNKYFVQRQNCFVLFSVCSFYSKTWRRRRSNGWKAGLPCLVLTGATAAVGWQFLSTLFLPILDSTRAPNYLLLRERDEVKTNLENAGEEGGWGNRCDHHPEWFLLIPWRHRTGKEKDQLEKKKLLLIFVQIDFLKRMLISPKGEKLAIQFWG